MCRISIISFSNELNNEELENKFDTLALLFAIDGTTVKDRVERQKRYRDQTETNLAIEIERLTEKIHRIRPLCVDIEKTEFLSDLLTQVSKQSTMIRSIIYFLFLGRCCDEGCHTRGYIGRKIWSGTARKQAVRIGQRYD